MTKNMKRTATMAGLWVYGAPSYPSGCAPFATKRAGRIAASLHGWPLSLSGDASG